MNIKNINFICGLPRSGSTLLATLLNQHPEIYASPHSALVDGVSNLHKTFTESESVHFSLRLSAYQQTLWTLPHLFYQDIEKNIIFDKHFIWSTPENYRLALKISNNPRFIVCYRPVLEILASFVDVAVKNVNFYLNKELDSVDYYYKKYLSRNDAMAEYLMQEPRMLPNSILGLVNAKKNENSGMFKFVSYDSLVTDPQKEMFDIFNFLKIKPIEIQTENLEDIFQYKDAFVLGVDNFHRIKQKIKKTSTKPEDLFSNFILDKYKNALAPAGF